MKPVLCCGRWFYLNVKFSMAESKQVSGTLGCERLVHAEFTIMRWTLLLMLFY